MDYSAVIFNSRTAIDHFFRICEELRVQVPDTMKYFCTSESIAVYLQKYGSPIFNKIGQVGGYRMVEFLSRA